MKDLVDLAFTDKAKFYGLLARGHGLGLNLLKVLNEGGTFTKDSLEVALTTYNVNSNKLCAAVQDVAPKSIALDFAGDEELRNYAKMLAGYAELETNLCCQLRVGVMYKVCELGVGG